MSLYGLGRDFYVYTSDDGSDYVIGTTDDNAAVNSATPVLPAGYPALPRGWKVRHVIGFNATKGRMVVPCFTESSSLWNAATTFTKHGNAYTITSRIGELRALKR